MEKFWYFWYGVSRNVSGSQEHSWTQIVVATNLDEADKMIKEKYPNHLIYLEGYQKIAA